VRNTSNKHGKTAHQRGLELDDTLEGLTLSLFSVDNNGTRKDTFGIVDRFDTFILSLSLGRANRYFLKDIENYTT
jgi:hypothetical protein